MKSDFVTFELINGAKVSIVYADIIGFVEETDEGGNKYVVIRTKRNEQTWAHKVNMTHSEVKARLDAHKLGQSVDEIKEKIIKLKTKKGEVK